VAFQKQIAVVVEQYMKQTVRSDRTTVYNALTVRRPSLNLAELIRRLLTWLLRATFFAHPSSRKSCKLCTTFTTSTGDTFKLALYNNSASFTAATTAYTATNEVANSGSYAAGGGALTNVTPTTSGTTAFTDFDDLTFTSATITARGALIYNDTAAGDPTVAVLDFGADKTSTAGDFQIVMPTADASTAIIRIA